MRLLWTCGFCGLHLAACGSHRLRACGLQLRRKRPFRPAAPAAKRPVRNSHAVLHRALFAAKSLGRGVFRALRPLQGALFRRALVPCKCVLSGRSEPGGVLKGLPPKRGAFARLGFPGVPARDSPKTAGSQKAAALPACGAGPAKRAVRRAGGFFAISVCFLPGAAPAENLV